MTALHGVHICTFNGQRLDGPIVGKFSRCEHESGRGRCTKLGTVGILYVWGGVSLCERHALEEVGAAEEGAAPNVSLTELEHECLLDIAAGNDPLFVYVKSGEVALRSIRRAIASLESSGLTKEGVATESVRRWAERLTIRASGVSQ